MASAKKIRCFDYVNQRYEFVRDALRADPDAMLRQATSGAAGRARSLAPTLHVEIAGIDVAKEVQIDVQCIQERKGVATPVIVLSLAWRAHTSDQWFPVMEADLSAYPLSKDETQLELTGRYDPPLGTLGRALDSLVLHRVAEASVHRFLREIAAHLQNAKASSQP